MIETNQKEKAKKKVKNIRTSKEKLILSLLFYPLLSRSLKIGNVRKILNGRWGENQHKKNPKGIK